VGEFTVAVVEDHRALRLALERKLAGLAGVRLVASAEDGPSGMEAILSSRPTVAVVDHGLPGFDGLEVIRRVRAAEGDCATRFVVWSATLAPRMLDGHGIDGFVSKDQPMGALLAEIRRLGAVEPSPS
jgi:two-component system nitrate/nitrite response regulator NarL